MNNADEVKEVYKYISREDIERAASGPSGTKTDIPCLLCGKPMVVQGADDRRMLICAGHPKCKMVLIPDMDYRGINFLMKMDIDVGTLMKTILSNINKRR